MSVGLLINTCTVFWVSHNKKDDQVFFKLMRVDRKDVDLHESQENDHGVDNICDLADHIRCKITI